MNVNIKSIYHSINAFVPPLLSSGRGASIINISSIGSTRPRGGLVWYNASKGAVTNATLGLANEYGKHQIRVNAVCPLLGVTGLFSHFTGEEDTPAAREKFVSNVPMGRLCEPEDVASACLWLASDESRFVTGVSIKVDGGKTIG
jgi:NAD(P)-dependent dehydrogenase (short-subunit alcohol dehydrogenase family)